MTAAYSTEWVKDMVKTGETEHHKHIKTNFLAKEKDCCFLLDSGDIAFIQNKVADSAYLCSVIREGSLQNYVNQSCDSKIFGIFWCSGEQCKKSEKIWSQIDFKRKLGRLPIKVVQLW